MQSALPCSLACLGLIWFPTELLANVPVVYDWEEPRSRPVFLTFGAVAFAYMGVMLLILFAISRGTMRAGKALAVGLSVSLFFCISPCCFTVVVRGGESTDFRFVGAGILPLGPGTVGMCLALLCGVGGLLWRSVCQRKSHSPTPRVTADTTPEAAPGETQSEAEAGDEPRA